MMGSGKTTLGRLTAERLDCGFLDVDAVVEKESGMPITGIFREFGEAEFRRRELEAIRRLLAQPGRLIVAAGGGAFCQDAARRHMQANALTVFLHVPEAELLRRLERGGVAARPLLADADWRTRVADLVRERYPVYREARLVFEAAGEAPPDSAARLADAIRRLEADAAETGSASATPETRESI